jgi:iron complex outermembrane receptor protein
MSKRVPLTGIVGIASIASIAALGAPASAQVADENPGASEEIVVTAQRRSERLENVPLSITAVTADTLSKSGVTRFQDLANVSPGVMIRPTGAYTQPSIRGITTLTLGLGFENNVAVYIDGFYQATATGMNGDLANVADVQILKGPQGTLYGRNATGGAILINTLAPSEELTGSIEGSYGRFHDRRLKAYLSGPLGDGLGFSIAGYTRRSDGYLRDVGTDGRGTNGFDTAPVKNDTVRAKLRAELGDAVALTLGYNYVDLLDARGLTYTDFDHTPATFPGTAVPYPQPPLRATRRNTTSNTIRPSNRDLSHDLTATLAWDTGIGKLTSYTGYTFRKEVNDFDFDGTKVDALGGFGRGRERTFQQSVDYAINAVPKLDLTIGGSYFHDYLRLRSRTTIFGSDLSLSFTNLKTEAWAVYADGTYHFNDRLFLTLGARYSHEKKGIDYFQGAGALLPPVPPADKSASFKKATYRGVLRYELAPRTNVYASITTGFRPGVYQPSPVADPSLVIPAKQESITAYEIGFKTASHNLRFETAAYYYDYKNLQVGVTIPNPLSPSSIIVTVLNARRAEVYGADGSITYTPVERLNLRAALAYIHGRYKSFRNASGTGLDAATNTNVSPQAQDWSGQEMSRAPKLTANIGGDYSIDFAGGHLNVSSNLSYTSSQTLADPSLYGPLAGAALANKQRFRDNAYWLLNGQIQWRDPSDRFSIAVYGDNLTNAKYYLTHAGGSYGDWRVYGEPVTYGVRVGYKF